MKTRSFRLKLTTTELPPEVSLALRKCTKETSTVFAGKTGVKVRLLSAELLTDNTVTKLRKLTVSHKFSDWAEKWLDRKKTTLNYLTKAFHKHVHRYETIKHKICFKWKV